jgi:hypothetical protein
LAKTVGLFCSLKVGICSAPGRRLSEVTPRIRIWPDLTASIASPKPVEMAWVSPASTAAMALPPAS